VFLANMSHELRTPLNAIIGYSEIIKSLTFGPQAIDRYAEYAGDINTAGAHLLKVINDVLDTASIEAGKLKLNEETIDLDEVVRQSLAPLRLLSERKRITIHTAVADAPTVRADPLRLNQVFINLLSNALKFTPAGGHIYVEIASGDDGGVICSVRDTGIGMSPEQATAAQEPFVQLDDDLAKAHQGTGLGLPLAKRLIELHGGSLTIRSAQGEGTTMVVQLPAHRTITATAVRATLTTAK
jgi:signal transduction histidine kinase